ncbi:unnamed protein product [Prunus armeniaca]|uniref:Uncharacterized protein n=1 Tax=Prunus armeniaca TaxID=36596 RepID=A0A6J5V5K1_PRUAR|nr:unnamed protein product [Prunus armeniaca]CAB4311659.1 unnamed protein product [Prunus armeniaca]
MEDSGAILCHISTLKDMLDQVNEEIEANIQITREIESEIVKCSEIENALAAKESDLTKTLYVSHFELTGLLAVTKDLRNSVEIMEKELCRLRMKRDETLNRIHDQRERFIAMCLEFQKDIDKANDNDLCILLSEKEFLENEIHILEEKNNALKNSMLAFVEGILEDLISSNSALQVEIQSGSQENDKLLKDIHNMKSSLLSTIAIEDIRGSDLCDCFSTWAVSMEDM